MNDRHTRRRDRELARHGFTLVRSGKHQVFRNPEGRTVTFSSTPSDMRAVHKQIRDIKLVMRAPEPDSTVDATLPKAEKKCSGSARPNTKFRYRYDPAPRSIPATPEEELKTLRGLLASRQSYKFKSEFVRHAVVCYRLKKKYDTVLLEAVIDEFEDLAELLRQTITEGKIPETRFDLLIPDEMDTTDLDSKFNLVAYYYGVIARSFTKTNSPLDVDRIFQTIPSLLRSERSYYELKEEEKLQDFIGLASRIANHLLRGASREECRIVIDKQSLFDGTSMCDLIEEVAAEIITTMKSRT